MDEERRQKSLNALSSLNCNIPSDLSFHFIDSETEIREIDDIVYRSISLFCLATYADSLLQGNCSRDEARAFAEKFISRYNIYDHFTAKEKEFVDMKEPTNDVIGKFCWMWEALYSMLYCLGFVDVLGLPTEACKVSLCSRVFGKNRTTDAVLKAAKLRSKEQILDFADLIFCCNNAANKSQFESGVLGGWRNTADWITIINGKAIDWNDLI